jgi:hypothetical protein
MTLANLICKRGTGNIATAIPAISATQHGQRAEEVARIATVAVANLSESETYTVGHFSWLMHFIDRNPLVVTFSPEVSHAGALAFYPDAVAAEPIAGVPKRSATKTEIVALQEIINMVYRNATEAERMEALDFALNDPDGALLCYQAYGI